jgi:hypothetical protein
LLEGILTVHATNHVWCNELELLKETLLDSVRRAAPGATVRALRFRVGPMPPTENRPPPRSALPTPLAICALPEDVARALASVHDDALREALIRAALSSLSEPAAVGAAATGLR